MYEKYPDMIRKQIHDRLASAQELGKELKERKAKLAASKKSKPEKIAVSAQASNFGQISEQILPAFTTFPYKRTECRILFKPVDYIVFARLSQQRSVEAIKFVDVKTGGGRLDGRQRQIRDRITEGKIKHRVID